MERVRQDFSAPVCLETHQIKLGAVTAAFYSRSPKSFCALADETACAFVHGGVAS